MSVDSQKRFTIPIGPQHPALKEPGSFLFTVEGETVVGASVRLGYAHRGIEKGTEARSWTQSLYLVERTCGICSHVHALAFALGVEKLAGVEAPPRAQAIRLLLAEMERIHSHFLWLGVTAHEAGFDTLFMYAWRDREMIMDALEALSGNRVNYSANVIGGVKCDVTPELSDQILRAIDYLEQRTEEYWKVVSEDVTFNQRTRGIAIISQDQADMLGVTGPTARASHVARDVRIDAPYAAYGDFPTKMILDDAGDLAARVLVRLRELFESYRLIRMVVTEMPQGELTARVKRRIPEGETVSRVEAPRGDLFYFIQSGGDGPARVKVRTPTISNMGSVLHLTVGHQLADVPMILAGIDPCFSCNDRMVQVTHGSSNDSMTWEQLRRYGIDFYRRKGGK